MGGGTRSETLPFLSKEGACVATLRIFGDDTLERADVAVDEEPLQIVENGRYEYELTPADLRLVTTYGTAAVHRSANPALPNCGSIAPGSYVGRLSLDAVTPDGTLVGRAAVEVRSRKLSYRDDYRRMLEDIAEQSIALLSDVHSPVTGTITPDPKGQPATLQQQFEFLRALIGANSFRKAVHRVAQNPHRRREGQDQLRDLRRGVRLERRGLRAIATATRRVPLPKDHPLRRSIDSLPEKVPTVEHHDTEDTPENRFVKFILETFSTFLNTILKQLQCLGRPRDARLIASIHTLEAELRAFAMLDAFRRVGAPTFLPYRSVVMQRREGYREILRAWIQFQMGVRLVWSGGEDVYDSGKRDVARLYEYWVFFQLLRIAERTFRFDIPVRRELLVPTADGFGLRLRRNEQIDLVAMFGDRARPLRVRFSYNRRFVPTSDRAVAGSWTLAMQPDFTFSFWPAEFDEAEAEEQEVMVHLHFDAKYRIERLTEIFETAPEHSDAPAHESSMAHRTDLLKMHAYRDAIRRSHGAYVIYPGDESRECRGFHEVLPGLGAFVARPGRPTDDLSRFIADVARHASDRATARERQTYHSFDVHREPPRFEVRHRMPERGDDGLRTMPPAETFVLVGWCRDERHHEWIRREGLYNFRMDARSGSLRLTPEVVAAKYLLLHLPNHTFIDGLFQMTNHGPRVFSRHELQRRAYPTEPSAQNYLVYEVRPAPTFAATSWDGSRFTQWPAGRRSAAPFTVRLDEILSIAH